MSEQIVHNTKKKSSTGAKTGAAKTSTKTGAKSTSSKTSAKKPVKDPTAKDILNKVENLVNEEKAKKKPTITNYSDTKPESSGSGKPGNSSSNKPGNGSGSGKSSTGFRIGAIVLWVLAFATEILAIMVLQGTLSLSFMGLSKMVALIILIVIDMGLVIAAGQLWKKANWINPPSEKNKFTFYLISELGVIMAVICFLPLIVLLIKNKDLDKKSKIIVTVIAIVALLISGLISADFDPISSEEKEDAIEQLAGTDVYWSPFGRKYHLDEDCSSLSNSETLTKGTVDEAIEEGRTSLCKFCAKKHPEYSGLKTEDGEGAVEETTEGGGLKVEPAGE